MDGDFLKGSELFKLINLNIRGTPFNIIEVKIDKTFLNKGIKQAKLKSKYTMDFNQAGVSRSNNIKYQKQLQGIIAEIGIQELLDFFFKTEEISAEVIRWDDIRTDGFKSSENEFDIKIKTDKKEFLVESRSSISYKTTISQAIINLDIIGPYISSVKKNEKRCDFYIRPLFQYEKLSSRIEHEKTEEFIKNREMLLYIMAGITYDELMQKGYEGSLGQYGTRYKLIKMIDADDIVNFLYKLKDIVEDK